MGHRERSTNTVIPKEHAVAEGTYWKHFTFEQSPDNPVHLSEVLISPTCSTSAAEACPGRLSGCSSRGSMSPCL